MELIKKVQDGRIPESWDGHELRELLADKFAAERSEPLSNKRGARYKAYRNALLSGPASQITPDHTLYLQLYFEFAKESA